MRRFYISQNDAGQRTDKFVTKVTTNMPKSLLYKSFRNGLIRCNGKRCHYSNILKEGDVVELFIYEEFLPKETPLSFVHAPVELTIVYEDENILLADKPSGLLTHGDASKQQDTLLDRVLHYLYQSGAYRPEEEHSFAPACVNRLDRNTRGLLIIAKNFPTLQLLSEKMKQREIDRWYLCQVQGIPVPAESTLVGYHTKDRKNNVITITPQKRPNARQVATAYRVLSSEEQTSWMEVLLLTGRSHQIRAHLASIGHPLIGDKKYGYQGPPLGGQQLYAYKITFSFASPSQHLTYLTGKSFVLEHIPYFS